MLFLKSTTVTKAPGIYDVDIAAKPPGKTFGVFMATDPDNPPAEVLAALASMGGKHQNGSKAVGLGASIGKLTRYCGGGARVGAPAP